ncbi:DUF262 domain-containing protein [Flavobacterium eburneipallidum]|uniref:DUF262 domain-containing protein n=1 Tax=Flavobacterium eburneipallidum TaxID=3003263 RepID=UPI002482E1CF|nr:DUF262 domain-containing protein [Flavobacterium eburneipallidum]
MGHIANKIDAKDVKLLNVFYGNRYKIDVFQREYRWQREQIEALISDLSSSFFNNYEDNHTIETAVNYDCYYMGPIVLCDDNNSLSIVDGQQRLTSFTLLIIYLHHLQNILSVKDDQKIDLENYIFVKKGGKKTLVLNVESRSEIINHLYSNENFIHEINFEDPNESYDYLKSIVEESIENIKNRYDDIIRFFPPELKTTKILSIFIEWLLNRVVLVEIKAYNIENAYTIFETMNDRGLSLNPTEILKAYLLSNIKEESKAIEANEKWKYLINLLKTNIGQDADLEFFRNWLRSKFAITRRGTFKGSENEDFEKIGVQFHAWVKNNHKKLNLKKDNDYYYFIQSNLSFYIDEYLSLYSLKNSVEGNSVEDFYITNAFTIADSLTYPLYLAPVNIIDSTDVITEKYLIVNKFLDNYTNIRMLCNRAITQSSIRNYFYDLIKEIRNNKIEDLYETLNRESEKLKEIKANIDNFQVDNWGYYHYFYARVNYFFPKTREEYIFSELLRSRKQSSFVLTQIFNNEELQKYFEDTNVNDIEHTIGNFCLIRRYEVEDFNKKQTRHKISYLLKRNYIPEMNDSDLKDIEILNFVINRNAVLKTITKEIWL